MRITGDGIWGPPKDRDAAIAVLRRAVELGVNFIDTADSYGPEVSEELIAEALHPYPGGLVIATKGGLTRSGPSQWERDGRPEHLREACEGSLRRLRVERIDVYQLHAVDPEVPLEESVGTLSELRDEGKVGHVGVSNFDTRPARPGARDRPHRLGPEPLLDRRPRSRAGTRGLRPRRHRVHPLVPARVGRPGRRGRAQPHRRRARSDPVPGRAGLAPGALPRDASDPGHVVRRPPRGERRRRIAPPDRGRVRGAERARGVGKPFGGSPPPAFEGK